MNKDQACWFDPKADPFEELADMAKAWREKPTFYIVEATECNDDVQPHADTIYNISFSSSVHGSKVASAHSSRASSSASSVRLKAELDRAALLVKASALKHKKKLVEKEAKLRREKVYALKQKQILDEKEAKLEREKEELEIHTALAVTDAKIKTLNEFEALLISTRASSHHGMNSCEAPDKERNLLAPRSANDASFSIRRAPRTDGVPQSIQRLPVATAQPPAETLETSQDVAELLTKQQNPVTRPPQSIPMFQGDPLEYHLFIRAFEHGVEDKTTSNKDRLYYMELCTGGKPRELIRSCLHMEPEHGYYEAKRLLEEHFGNADKISLAYIKKALNWPTIKSHERDALQSFGLYLTGCRNAVTNLEHMEELNSAASMRAIIAKLPYKLRERWRSMVCGIQDEENRSAKFDDLVEFVNKQASNALHPLFSHIKDFASKSQTKGQVDERLHRRKGSKSDLAKAGPSPQLLQDQQSSLSSSINLETSTSSAPSVTLDLPDLIPYSSTLTCESPITTNDSLVAPPEAPAALTENSPSDPNASNENQAWNSEETAVLGRRASLSDLSGLDDIEELSVRQLKEILARNFVNYKGCCEKWELMERVSWLYQDQQNLATSTVNASEASHGLVGPEEKLCKICMDSPINCVLLNCGHMITCCKCGKRMSECPICRQYVIRAVHVFQS